MLLKTFFFCGESMTAKIALFVWPICDGKNAVDYGGYVAVAAIEWIATGRYFKKQGYTVQSKRKIQIRLLVTVGAS